MRDASSWPATTSYFARRWRGEVALGVLFWRDVLVVGTLINLYASFAAMLMVAQGVNGQWAWAVHLAPLPYNLFLLAAVWRSRQRTMASMLVAMLWFVAVVVV